MRYLFPRLRERSARKNCAGVEALAGDALYVERGEDG